MVVKKKIMLVYKSPVCLFLFIKKNTLWVKDTESVVRMPQFNAGESNKGRVVLLTGRCAFTDGGLCMTGLSHASQKDFIYGTEITRLRLIERQTHSVSMNPSRSYDTGQTLRLRGGGQTNAA